MTQTILIVSNSYKSSLNEGALKRKLMRTHPIAPYILAGQVDPYFNAEVCEIEDIEMHYGRNDLALVAFSSNVTRVVPLMYSASKVFHEQNTPVVWGGVHASSVPSEVLSSGYVRSVIVGQGEYAWLVLQDDLKMRQLSEVYYGTPGAKSTLLAEEREALASRSSVTLNDELLLGKASPNWDYLASKPLVLTVETTRGCNNRCPHCSTYKVAGSTFQRKDIRLVISEVALALHYSRLPYVVFVDNNLSQDPDYAIEMLDYMEYFDARFICMASITQLVENEQLVAAMSKAGMDTVCMGLESLTQSNHHGNDKDVPAFREGIALLHAHGIAAFGSFILGFDTDTRETVDEITAFCDESGLDLINPNILTPFPGTPLHRAMQKQGRIETNDYSLYDARHAVISTPHLSRAELQREFERWDRKLYAFDRVARRVLKPHGTKLTKAADIVQFLSRI